MDKTAVLDLLGKVKENQVSTTEALGQLQCMPFDDLDFAKLDTHRYLRQGLPEIVFGQGKTAEQLIEIIGRLKAHNEVVVATKVSQEKARIILEALPEGHWHKDASIFTIGAFPSQNECRMISIISAGTSDLAVASEAAVMLAACGIKHQLISDVGVAGIHRLFDCLPTFVDSDAIVVVAGMDGALPSVVGGLVSCPVIAVPTSVGYGASFEGLAALLSMLNSCSAGVTVVNIDNGFGAAVAAIRLVNQMALRERQ